MAVYCERQRCNLCHEVRWVTRCFDVIFEELAHPCWITSYLFLKVVWVRVFKNKLSTLAVDKLGCFSKNNFPGWKNAVYTEITLLDLANERCPHAPVCNCFLCGIVTEKELTRGKRYLVFFLFLCCPNKVTCETSLQIARHSFDSECGHVRVFLLQPFFSRS